MSFKCCHGCTERWVKDGKRCHDTCERFIAAASKRKAERDNYTNSHRGEKEANLYMFESMAKREHKKHRRVRRYW